METYWCMYEIVGNFCDSYVCKCMYLSIGFIFHTCVRRYVCIDDDDNYDDSGDGGHGSLRMQLICS